MRLKWSPKNIASSPPTFPTNNDNSIDIYIIGMYFFPDVGVDQRADQDILSAWLIHTYGTGLEAGILGVLVSVVVAAAAEWGYIVLLEAHVVVNL